MPKQRTDDSIPAGDDVVCSGDGAAGESGVGGGDQPADVGAVLYTDLRQFLIASASDKRTRFSACDHSLEEVYGLASTEHQFRKALAEQMFQVKKLSRDELQRLMAAALKTMGADAG